MRGESEAYSSRSSCRLAIAWSICGICVLSSNRNPLSGFFSSKSVFPPRMATGEKLLFPLAETDGTVGTDTEGTVVTAEDLPVVAVADVFERVAVVVSPRVVTNVVLAVLSGADTAVETTPVLAERVCSAGRLDVSGCPGRVQPVPNIRQPASKPAINLFLKPILSLYNKV